MHNFQKINDINVSTACVDKLFHIPTWNNASKD